MYNHHNGPDFYDKDNTRAIVRVVEQSVANLCWDAFRAAAEAENLKLPLAAWEAKLCEAFGEKADEQD